MLSLFLQHVKQNVSIVFFFFGKTNSDTNWFSMRIRIKEILQIPWCPKWRSRFAAKSDETHQSAKKKEPENAKGSAMRCIPIRTLLMSVKSKLNKARAEESRGRRDNGVGVRCNLRSV